MPYARNMPGTSFDKVASIYDATRGGERRGDGFADALAPWIIGPTVVELGVGTGVIANGLQRQGIAPVGFDLSDAMLRAAVDRIGRRVAVADIDALPLPDACVDTAYIVWVLQLVADPVATLTETRRVVRPGGRVIAILSNGEYDPADEIAKAIDGLSVLRSQRFGRSQLVEADPSGLELVHDGFTPWDGFPQAPAEEIANIEARIYSSLFDVDDATWVAVVEPVLEQLRALENPAQPRPRRNRHPLLVWDVV
jgi:SAM-dependent methyltransferase